MVLWNDHIQRLRSCSIGGYSFTATAIFPRHHALKYRTFLATSLPTAVAVAVNSDTALDTVQNYYHSRGLSIIGHTPVLFGE